MSRTIKFKMGKCKKKKKEQVKNDKNIGRPRNLNAIMLL